MLGTMEERVEEIKRRYPVWEKHTLWTRFRKNAAQHMDRAFLVSESGTYTYGEMTEKVTDIAACLWAAGMRPGSHVAVMLHNRPEAVSLIFAIAKIGAVKVPLNAHMKKDEMETVLSLADVDLLITENEIPSFILDKNERIKKVIVKDQKVLQRERSLSWDAFLKLGKEKDTSEMEPVCSRCQDPEGVSDIFFTSGSTSVPKGVTMTHEMVLRSAYSTCLSRCMEEGRRLFIPIPLFHAFAYIEGIMAMMMIGGTAVLMEERFSSAHAFAMMKEHRVNDIVCVSVIMTKLLTECAIKPEDLPDMHAAYWASICPDWVWDAGRKALGITDISTGYGMTECGSTVSMIRPSDPPDRVVSCNGRVKAGGCVALSKQDDRLLEVRICDPVTKEEVEVGQEGELWCRGKTVTKGYYHDPAADAAAFEADGWFHTGDICRMDEEGYLTFLGRDNDMYKINGENVSPQFVDKVIGSCPIVLAVETVGIYHPKYGAVGVAFVDAAVKDDASLQVIRAHCKEHLASFQIPRYLFYLDKDAFPKTGTGKISKKLLRVRAQQMVEALDESQPHAWESGR